MGRTSSINMPSMGDPGSRAGCRRKSVIFLPAAMPVLFLQTSPKNGFFAPQGRHVATINVKVGTGERTEGPLPRANFHGYRGKNVGTQAPKLSKFRILARNLYLRGNIFTKFSAFVRVYR